MLSHFQCVTINGHSSNFYLYSQVSPRAVSLAPCYFMNDINKCICEQKADFSPPLDFYTNELTIHMCIIANSSLVCFPRACFLGLSNMLEWSSNGSSITRQACTQLEIATRLARELGYQIGYYL